MASGPTYRPSPALAHWRTVGQAEMDELLAAHRAVGGAGPGRRTATRQINHALVVQLAAQFQRFSRALHDLCADAMTAAAPPTYHRALESALTVGRRLDVGNAQAASLGSDFGRFGLQFWASVDAVDPRGPGRRRRLEQLAIWRNAIAHQDFRRPGKEPVTARTRIDLDAVRTWRAALDQLAETMDQAMFAAMIDITGSRPW